MNLKMMIDNFLTKDLSTYSLPLEMKKQQQPKPTKKTGQRPMKSISQWLRGLVFFFFYHKYKQ